ncbi:MAG: class I SAM-dependent methyltransferase [Myxococcota bacterium]
MSNSPASGTGPETANHQKYTEGAQNPIVRRLMDRLFSRVREVMQPLDATTYLDAGCGEGHSLAELADVVPPQVTGFDLNPEVVAFTQKRHPEHSFSVQSIYELPYDDNAFDVVLCMEVLEHLETPGRALAELTRVCGGTLILSVPYEPWFQLGNLARGKYREGWGNHPEHIQHWGLRTFKRFVQAEAGLADVQVREAWPWIVASAQVRTP